MNSNPPSSNQMQPNPSSAQAMMMQNNNFQVNPNLGQIQFQQQQQQQMGMNMNMMNPPPQNQIACNGNNNVTAPNRPPFMNFPNQNFSMQNGTGIMRPGGQNFVPMNMNMNPMGMNCAQPTGGGGGGGGQFFGQNAMNSVVPFNTQNFMLPNGQFFNPMNVMSLPNGGQFCQQNANQNMLQLLQMQMQMQMQMPNFGQGVPGNLQLLQNQVALGMPQQNPNFPGNQQFGLPNSGGIVQQHGNQGQQKLISPVMGNLSTTNQLSGTGQQLQVNSSMPQSFGPVQTQQAQSLGPPGFTKPQGNLGNNNGINNANINGNGSHSKNFTRHPKNDASQRGFNPQFHQKQNLQGKNRFNQQHGTKGFNNGASAKSDDPHSTNPSCTEKKPLPLNYTEQEIQQWREARKKNYPTKANVDKMVGEKQMLQEVADRDAKLRRQQLKDILAKQAELGCEVADIPATYLSDSEQGHTVEGNKKEWGKKGRFKNKFNKRGRSNQAERFSKKQKSENLDPSNSNIDENTMKQQRQNGDHKTRHALKKKQPSLLQKLLAADLNRDKSHLLQVFRFMAANSFFKDFPEKPLRFPSVIIKETGVENEVSGRGANPVADDSVKLKAQASEGEKKLQNEVRGEKVVLVQEGEEGEIID